MAHHPQRQIQRVLNMVVSALVVLFGLLQASVFAINWGTTFQGLAPCHNVRYDCQHNGSPTCCGLLDPTEEGSTNANPANHQKVEKSDSTATSGVCTITKEYISSPYEEKNFAKAEDLHKIADTNERYNGLIQFIHGEIPASHVWLDRVKKHMDSEVVPEATKDDLEYLSRFQVTKTCTGAYSHLSSSWVEWIEPLTVHARHPFAMQGCKNVYTPDQKAGFGNVGVQSLDYILIKSGQELHEATSLSRHNHTRLVPHRNQNTIHRADHIQSRNFMFDAGTSTFESSLKWFLCAYLQVNQHKYTSEVLLIPLTPLSPYPRRGRLHSTRTMATSTPCWSPRTSGSACPTA